MFCDEPHVHTHSRSTPVRTRRLTSSIDQPQTVLQDLSAGLALLADRPFELGDFVKTGGFTGVVTSIGMKVRGGS